MSLCFGIDDEANFMQWRGEAVVPQLPTPE